MATTYNQLIKHLKEQKHNINLTSMAKSVGTSKTLLSKAIARQKRTTIRNGKTYTSYWLVPKKCWQGIEEHLNQIAIKK